VEISRSRDPPDPSSYQPALITGLTVRGITLDIYIQAIDKGCQDEYQCGRE